MTDYEHDCRQKYVLLPLATSEKHIVVFIACVYQRDIGDLTFFVWDIGTFHDLHESETA